jgi:hypothetical protein
MASGSRVSSLRSLALKSPGDLHVIEMRCGLKKCVTVWVTR